MDSILQRAPTCVGDNLRRTSRAITQRYDAALSEVGISVGQFSLLARLAGLGRQGAQPPTLGDLATALSMDRTTLTRALRPLQRDGLVRVVEGQDRRTRVVQLLDAGRSRLQEALPLWDATQKQILRRFGSSRWADLRNELDALAESAG